MKNSKDKDIEEENAVKLAIKYAKKYKAMKVEYRNKKVDRKKDNKTWITKTVIAKIAKTARIAEIIKTTKTTRTLRIVRIAKIAKIAKTTRTVGTAKKMIGKNHFIHSQ